MASSARLLVRVLVLFQASTYIYYSRVLHWSASAQLVLRRRRPKCLRLKSEWRNLYQLKSRMLVSVSTFDRSKYFRR